MATNNSANQQFTNNADGFDIAGGATKRKLSVTGADVTVTGAGTANITLPGSSTTLVGRDTADTLMNKNLSDGSNVVSYLTLSNPANFSVYAGGTITVDSTNTVVIPFSTKEWDTGSNFSTSTNRFTAPVSGYYDFIARVVFNSSSYSVQISLGVNGTVMKKGEYGPASGVLVMGRLKLNAGDYVTIIGFSSTSQGITAGQQNTFFQGSLYCAS